MLSQSWRVAATYSYLDNLGVMAFAWEYLRRNPDYQKAYELFADNGDPETSEQVAPQWGLHLMVDPDLPADRAHVSWLPHLNPATVVVAPAPDKFTKARSISELTPAFFRRIANGEHLLLDQGGELPIALIDGADTASPAAIVIPLDDGVTTRIEAAIHFWETMTGHAPGRTLGGLTAQQRAKLKLILRTLDGKSAKCSYRTIAKVLFGPSSVPDGHDWGDNCVRNHIRRLYKRGEVLMHGGYLDLLLHPRRFRG
jgi:hypothetical protein